MKRFKDDETEQIKDEPNSPEEQKFIAEILADQDNAEAVRQSPLGDGFSSEGIEQVWEDEAKILSGDQWSTSFAYRTDNTKKTRPNSVNNFVFSAVMNITDNITVSSPEVVIEGREENDKEIAEALTYMSRFNDGIHRNNFKKVWRKIVSQFIGYGPAIGEVIWNNDWIGGSGPNRWIGDVQVAYVDRRNIYFDPAILDLEVRLQECEFIHRKYRKKLSWIKDKFDKGKHVSEELNEYELQDEGADPKQAWLIERWHRGKPKFISAKQRKTFLEKADEFEAMGDTYRAQDCQDMASGNLHGVHRAYVANGVFLEYEPYVYEDGQYPFVYKLLYSDENHPYGFGEIRNVKVPQVMHNKADEIEIEAMSREGLGGMYYTNGAITKNQKESILANSGKGGAWLEVENVNQLRDREGVKVPQSIREYKEHKQRMIETISQNTPIQQGMSPGANIPYKAIVELGARTDVRTKAKTEILETFLIEINKLRISRFVQFYTEDRYYRLKGADGNIVDGILNSDMLFHTWEREDGKVERFVPEFDIDVKVMDEKPTDRNYYTQTAMEMLKLGGMTIEHLWYVLDEGKFPPKNKILEDLKQKDMAMQIMELLEERPELAEQIQALIQGGGEPQEPVPQEQMMLPQGEQPMPQQGMEEAMRGMSDEELELLASGQAI